MSAAATLNQNVDINAKVKCLECGHENHSLLKHLKDEHGLSVSEYHAKHGHSAEVLSVFGKKVYDEMVGRPDVAQNYEQADYPSLATFGIGFGKDGKKDKLIRGYKGFTHEDGLPPVDEYYHFQPDVTRDVLMGLMTGGNIYAMGPTGSGKTTLFEQIAALTGRPFYRLQFHGQMEPVELTGMWTVNEQGAMEYMESGLVQALRKPSMICFDEYDSGNPVVTAISNALLEGKPMVLSNKGGEHVYPHPDCVIVATGNTNGMGDDTGLYASTSVQSFATMNRFAMFVVIDYMEADIERALLEKKYPKMLKEDVADVVKLANKIREAYKAQKITCVFSTRQLISFAEKLSMTGDVSRSFKLAFRNQLDDQDGKVIDELFHHIFGKR